MKYWMKYATAIAGGTVIGGAYILPSEMFLAFLAAWLLLIPATVVVYLAYGLLRYMKDRKQRIMVSIKPNEALNAIVRREAELKKEKERLYEEIRREVNRV